jgi:hypothetical protein
MPRSLVTRLNHEPVKRERRLIINREPDRMAASVVDLTPRPI